MALTLVSAQPLDELDHAQIALQSIVDGLQGAQAQGVPGDVLANAALTAALGLLVQVHGEETTSRLLLELPERVLAGQFTSD